MKINLLAISLFIPTRNRILKTIIKSTLLLCFVIFTGCAAVPPQTPISFDEYSDSSANPKTITVTMDQVPNTGMTYPGASCLLCLGVAAAANSGLSSHAKTLDNSDLKSLGADVTDALGKLGFATELLDTPLELGKLKKADYIESTDARKDFTVLKETVGSSHLLVIDINYNGLQRGYANYFPTSDPYSLVTGVVYLVDLTTNQYEWYLPISEQNSAGQEWKEPPEYPGITNSWHQGVATVREQILSALKPKQ